MRECPQIRERGCPSKSPKSGTIAQEQATAAILWETRLAAVKGKEREYDMAAYRAGEVVNHRTFGKGIVLKNFLNRCEMLFKDKERLVVSANRQETGYRGL